MANYLLGLDASYAQGGNINFAQVKSQGYEFWLQRMSYAYPGQGCKLDTTAAVNYEGAKAAGFIVGGYHKVGWTDPIAEADFFLAAMAPLVDGDLYAYDKEPSSDAPIPSNWAAWEQAFVQRIHDKIGVWPFDYSNISMFNAMPRQGVVKNCGAWIAAPSFGFDAVLPVNTTVMMQQGPTARVAGIPGNVVDTDAFFGTREELLAYGYHTPATTTVAPPPAPPTTTTTTTTEAPAPRPPLTEPTTTASPTPPPSTTTTTTQTVATTKSTPTPPKQNWFWALILALIHQLQGKGAKK